MALGILGPGPAFFVLAYPTVGVVGGPTWLATARLVLGFAASLLRLRLRAALPRAAQELS